LSLWSEIKQRRITQIVVTYLVTGWIVVSVVDQPVDRGVLPEFIYQVVLTLFLFGTVAALIIGWYHGEKGEQEAPPIEVAMLVVLGLGALGSSGMIVRSALQEGAVVSSGIDPSRIAVLYYEDLSDGDLVPVADGITEALIDQLDGIRSLDVVSRNGVRPYRDQDLRADSVARLLGVGTVIQGSVEQRGDDLRITTRLVDGLSGADIERAVTEIPAGEFLAARDSVAEGVSRLLRERLGEEVQLRELQAGTANAEAWALVQRAERLRSDAEDTFEESGDIQASIAAYEAADEVLTTAEQLDPQWVRPIVGRAHAAYRRAWFAANLGDFATTAEEIETGLGHADRALALDPDNADALQERGLIKLFTAVAPLGLAPDEVERTVSEAAADLQAAVDQDGSLATAHANLSFLYAGMEDWVNAVLSARRALEEDAYLRGADRIYDRLFQAQYNLEQFRDAEQWCDEGRSRFPENFRFTECRLWLMAAPYGEPEPDSAWAALARLDSLAPGPLKQYMNQVGRIMVGGVLRRAELPDSAAAVFADIDHSEAVDPQRQLFIYEAGIRASTGDPDGAIDALRRWAAATPGSTLGPGAERNWWWRDLRGNAAFQPFVSR
jgi:serine/threonine-protein kinase